MLIVFGSHHAADHRAAPQPRHCLAIHRDQAKRRLEVGHVRNRGTAQGIVVRDGQQHHTADVLTAQELVVRRRGLARIAIAGMRRDECNDLAVDLGRLYLGEEPIDLGRQLILVLRVPGAGLLSSPDAVGRVRGRGWRWWGRGFLRRRLARSGPRLGFLQAAGATADEKGHQKSHALHRKVLTNGNPCPALPLCQSVNAKTLKPDARNASPWRP